MGRFAEAFNETHARSEKPPVLPVTDVTFKSDSLIDQAPTEIVKEQLNAERQIQLNLSFGESDDVNPDEHAEALKLAPKVGLPADVVRRDLPQQRKIAQKKDLDFGKILKESPALAKVLSDPENAKIASDDIGLLTSLEKMMLKSAVAIGSGFVRGVHMTEEGVLASERGFKGKLEEEQQKRLDELEEMSKLESEYEGLMYGVNQASEIVGQMLSSFGETIMKTVKKTDTARFIKSIRDETYDYMPSSEWNDPLTNYAETIFDVEAGHFYMEMKDLKSSDGKSLDPELIKGGMTAVGTINTALEVVGLGFVAKPIGEGLRKIGRKAIGDQVKKQVLKKAVTADALKSFAKAYATAWGGETFTEILQENVNMGVTEVIKGMDEGEFKELTYEDWVETNKQIFQKVGSGMAFLALPGAIGNFTVDLQNIQEAEDTQAIMESVGNDAAMSKLRERMPDKFKEFVDSVEGAESVFIPVERFDEYFQTQGIDPDEVLSEMPEIRDQVIQARERDGHIEIPMGTYATHLAGTEHHQGLINDIKFDPTQLTPREAAEIKENLPELLDEYMKVEQDKIERTQEEQQAYDQMYEKVRTMLVDAGESPVIAANAAVLVPKLFNIIQERWGLDALKEYEKRGLDIRAPFEGKQPVDQLDLLIDRIRTQKPPSQEEIKADSEVAAQQEEADILLDFLQKNDIDIATATNEAIKEALIGLEVAETTGVEYNQALETLYQDAKGKTVTLEAVEEETGKVVSIQSDAVQALQETDDAITKLQELITCVSA